MMPSRRRGRQWTRARTQIITNPRLKGHCRPWARYRKVAEETKRSGRAPQPVPGIRCSRLSRESWCRRTPHRRPHRRPPASDLRRNVTGETGGLGFSNGWHRRSHRSPSSPRVILRNRRRGLIGLACGDGHGRAGGGRRGHAWSAAASGASPARAGLARAFRSRRRYSASAASQRTGPDIFEKRALITARQPLDSIDKRQPVDGPHVVHQFVDRHRRRLPCASSARPSNRPPDS